MSVSFHAKEKPEGPKRVTLPICKQTSISMLFSGGFSIFIYIKM